MRLPALTEYSLNPVHIHIKLPLDLLSPTHRDGHRWYVAYLRHSIALRLYVLGFEILMQILDIILDALYGLGLVLAYGAADVDVRPHEQGLEVREYAEHLVGVLGHAELIAQACGHARFDAFDALVVSTQCQVPELLAFV